MTIPMAHNIYYDIMYHRFNHDSQSDKKVHDTTDDVAATIRRLERYK